MQIGTHSDGILFYVNNERSYRGGFLGLGATAALSVVVLVGSVGWKILESQEVQTNALTAGARASSSGTTNALQQNTNTAQNSAVAASPYDPAVISDNVASKLAADYARMQQSGNYTAEQRAQVAQSLGANLKATVTYKSYTVSDIPTDTDTSYARMLTYRGDLQTSFAPLLLNKSPELDMLTKYAQTSDPTYLHELTAAANNYTSAAQKTSRVTVPIDAVTIQVNLLNAMQEFAATLNQMAISANDPFVEATLLNTYMKAQQNMFGSFNDLYTYYKSKHV
jgi:hypothetical protein